MHAAPSQQVRASGSTLVDVMFAISMVAFACASLFLLYSNALQLLQNQQCTEAATLCLQERIEALRGASWRDLTTSASLLTLLKTAPLSASVLPGYVEDVTIAPYPAAAGTPLHLRRTAGAESVVTDNTGLLLSSELRLDVQVSWRVHGRTHVRVNSVLVALGGLPR